MSSLRLYLVLSLCLLLISAYASHQHSREYLRKRKQDNGDTLSVDDSNIDKGYKRTKSKIEHPVMTDGDNGKKWQSMRSFPRRRDRKQRKNDNDNNMKKKKGKYPELYRDHHVARIRNEPNEFKIIANNEEDTRKTLL